MSREPGPIVLRISRSQREHIVVCNPSGGQLSLKLRLMAKFVPLDDGGFEIALDDKEFGDLCRQMGYGGGGWQNALTRCFRQAIERYLGWL